MQVTAAEQASIVAVEGQLVYVSDEDRFYVYDGSAWVRVGWGATSTGRTGWAGRRVANQSIATTTITSISWDTEDFDSDGFLTPTNATLTIPTGLAGIYMLTASVEWQSDPIDAGEAVGLWVQWEISGASQITYTESLDGNIVAIGGILHQGITAMKALSAADTITVRVYQRTAGSVNLKANCSLYRIGV